MIHIPFMTTRLLIACMLAEVASMAACDGGTTPSHDAADGPKDAPSESAAMADTAAETSGAAGMTNGAACGRSADCASGFCVDGVCCDTACSDTCRSCALTAHAGTCTPVVTAQDPDTCHGELICNSSGDCGHILGQSCGGAAECASGFCVSGVCCNEQCGMCQACNLPGAAGTCAPVPKLSDDSASGCTGDRTCDGLGHCKLKNGRACGETGVCASSFCSDGRCCDQACRETCHGCVVAGKEGACSVVVGQEDLDANVACAGVDTCDLAGGGMCELKDGQPCTVSTDCASGMCRSYFRDADQDGYGTPTLPVRRCDPIPMPPGGYVSAGNDCCDSDARVHPGQALYFSAATDCGGYDYNCSGQEELEHATCGMSTLTKPVPGCGMQCSFILLMSQYVVYTQGCR